MTHYNYSTDYSRLFDFLQEGFEAVAFAENNAYRISIKKFLPSEVNRIAFVSEIGLFSVSNEITAFTKECTDHKLRWIDPRPKVKELEWEFGGTIKAVMGKLEFHLYHYEDQSNLKIMFDGEVVFDDWYDSGYESSAAAQEWLQNHVNQFLQ